MLCYECSITGCPRDAIGVCSHCSVALCAEHAQLVAEEITIRIPVVKSVEQECTVGQDEGQTVSSWEADETDLATVS
jgi:hypothetical protein